MPLTVETFLDATTNTFTYVVADAVNAVAAVIDPVLDYDSAAGRISTGSADAVLGYLDQQQLDLRWVLETHIHADHLSACAYLKEQSPNARIGIGGEVTKVQAVFAERFGFGRAFATDGTQFDALFADGDTGSLGEHQFTVLATPGHTPGCVTYLFDDFAFVGDTLFMPDYGTARTDFPGGDASELFRSIQSILALPPHTTLYTCHDYGTSERSELASRPTVAEQRSGNVMINGAVAEADFVAARQSRDQRLKTPQLLYPAVQFNIHAGQLPTAEPNGVHYFKIPVRRS